MAIYAISDLHLSFENDKPMDVFGDQWSNYIEKVKSDWNKKVTENDLILLPGDFSWAMYLEDTYKDFEYINNLPGKKLLLKGNHDYWWTTLKKMREYLDENNLKNIDFLYNNSYEYEGCIIAGTRGWAIQEETINAKMIQREKARLELSLKNGIETYGENKEIIVCMHYPPFNKEFIEVMKKYNVKKCIYGHLHGEAIKEAKQGIIDNIEFKLVSADSTNFELVRNLSLVTKKCYYYNITI